MGTEITNGQELLETVLAPPRPWRVTEFEMDPPHYRILVHMRCEMGIKMQCPHCAFTASDVHDHRERRIRDLDWADFEMHLVFAVPRILCPEHNVVEVARPTVKRSRDLRRNRTLD